MATMPADSRSNLRFDQFFESGKIDIAVTKWRDQCSESAAKHFFLCSGGL